MDILSRKSMSLEEKSEFEILEDAAERRKEKIQRAEGRNIDGAAREYRAFQDYLRNGLAPSGKLPGMKPENRELLRPTPKEQRDLGEGIPAGAAYPSAVAGFFVPAEFSDKVEASLKFHSDFFASSTIIKTERGGVLGYPTSEDSTVSGELLYDGQQRSSTNSDIAATGQLNFRAYTISSRLVKISMDLVRDAYANFEDYLAGEFAKRLARATTPLFTTGGGATYMAGSPLTATPQPRGIMLDAVDSGITVIGDEAQATPDPTTQVGYLDLVALEHSVDVLYRRRGSWMMHDSTLEYIQTLKDRFSKPLWTAGISSDILSDDAPSGRILGYPVRLNMSMDQLGAGKKPVLFGDLSKYAIREARGWWVRLSERFIENGQMAYILMGRWDAALLDAGTHPVKFLKNHA
jgi:HK97 family phage major capsid protein